MKFGCALPADLFGDTPGKNALALCESFGGKEVLLRFCAQELDTVELRTIGASADPQFVLHAVELLHTYGIGATIHGTLAGVSDAEAFFAPYHLLFAQNLQACYNITIHPLAQREKTETLLREICKLAQDKKYPVFITLENQRIKEAKCESGLCADVADIVKKIASPYLGVCFDFGHSLSNERKFGCDEPRDSFYDTVRHTHVHSLGKRTHFPLGCGEALLERNIGALIEHGFDGILSLELSAERFVELYDAREAFVSSVAILKRAAAQVERRAAALSLYREDYGFYLRELRESFEQTSCMVGWLSPSGYVIRMGDMRIAVDVCTSLYPIPEEEKREVTAWLSEFDLVIITHAHGDHYDKQLIRALPDRVKLLIPDFMNSDAPNTVPTSDGFVFAQDDIKITFFESAHLSVREYGFAITYRGENYVFPADVRDYDAPHPVFENTRALFAHLWLGRANALRFWGDEPEKFCTFVKSFGAEVTYLAHLFDVHRTIEDMWTDIHFDSIKEHLINAHPVTVGDAVEFLE